MIGSAGEMISPLSTLSSRRHSLEPQEIGRSSPTHRLSQLTAIMKISAESVLYGVLRLGYGLSLFVSEYEEQSTSTGFDGDCW